MVGTTPTAHPPDNVRRGVMLLVAAVALFAVGDAMVKTLSADHSVAQIVWARYAFHTLVFLVVFARFGIVGQVRTKRPWLQLGRALLLLGATALIFAAFGVLPLADATAISFASPLLVTALSVPLLGERVGPRRWCAILVGFAGTLAIVRPGMAPADWAVLLPLGSALCYALYQILTRLAGRTEDARVSLFWTAAVGLLVASAIAPFYWTPPSVAGWITMAAMGGLQGFAHYLIIRAFEQAPAATVSPFHYTQIVWAALLGWLLFGQFPDAVTLAGLAVVILSGLYIWRQEAPRRPTFRPGR